MARAFEGCANLISVDFGKGVEEIGGCAFCNCVALEEIYLPDSLKSFGTGYFNGSRVSAFYGCKPRRISIGGIAQIINQDMYGIELENIEELEIRGTVEKLARGLLLLLIIQ